MDLISREKRFSSDEVLQGTWSSMTKSFTENEKKELFDILQSDDVSRNLFPLDDVKIKEDILKHMKLSELDDEISENILKVVESIRQYQGELTMTLMQKKIEEKTVESDDEDDIYKNDSPDQYEHDWQYYNNK